MWLLCLIVFAAMSVSDFIWAQCIIAATNELPMKAGLTSASMVALNSAVVCIYINNHWTILAATCGGFVGTYASVKLFSLKRKEDGR